MDVKQWDTLTAEAAALVERLTAVYEDARKANDYSRAAAALTIRRQAVKRWERRCDAWAVAAYGPGVR